MRKTMMTAALAMMVATGGCASMNGQTAAMADVPAGGDLLISNVTVIDPENARVLEAQDVLVTGERIVAVLPHGSQPITARQTIDGSGDYLMPGLFDMHSHASFSIVNDPSLKLFHANGITGVREMGSDCNPGGASMCLDAMKEQRAEIEAGERIGPRLVELSSRKVSQRRGAAESEYELFYRPANPEQARATVAFLHDRGAEILKLSSEWQPAVFAVFMDEANARGLKTGGHLPFHLSSADAAEMGVTSIEHGRDLPMDCATVGAEFRAIMRESLERMEAPDFDRRSIPGRSVAEYDEAQCRDQVERMAAAGVYYVPTHLTREMDYRAGEEAYRDDPRLQYISLFQQMNWNQDLDRTAQAPPDFVEQLAGFYALGLKTTGMAHAAGVKVMAGTDANDTMVFPGFSLHDELGNLVEAGLTEMEALQAATSVPAEYLDRVADFGGISAGKLADMVLLDENPLVDIDHSDTIVAVVQGGRVSDRAALDALLEEVRRFAGGGQASED